MSVSELTAMLNKDKQSLSIISGKAKKVVLLDVKTNQTLYFTSLASCAEYFRYLGGYILTARHGTARHGTARHGTARVRP